MHSGACIWRTGQHVVLVVQLTGGFTNNGFQTNVFLNTVHLPVFISDYANWARSIILTDSSVVLFFFFRTILQRVPELLLTTSTLVVPRPGEFCSNNCCLLVIFEKVHANKPGDSTATALLYVVFAQNCNPTHCLQSMCCSQIKH
ncbi:hypothetical protein PR048_002498 [Dryococelus australis]|uniref:Uncharacterized protein n=1 Tax=Dryococelus australis TaxID=614101 RepID=A0ABQ9IKE4_9NEOP|nr:hypothetical protein PR048_002498 [Dryococelus australis]